MSARPVHPPVARRSPVRPTADVDSLLALVESTDHLIHKERMMHEAAEKARAKAARAAARAARS